MSSAEGSILAFIASRKGVIQYSGVPHLNPSIEGYCRFTLMGKPQNDLLGANKHDAANGEVYSQENLLTYACLLVIAVFSKSRRTSFTKACANRPSKT